MVKKNILADTIDAAGACAKYDEWARKLVSQKIILAWLLKYCTEEFSGYSLEYIRDNCIEGKAEVGVTAVHQDSAVTYKEGNTDNKSKRGRKEKAKNETSEQIQGLNTVDASAREGKVVYDIRFKACVPGVGITIQLLINIEIQLDDRPGYPITKRGIYYGARMISSQYGTVFKNEEYDKLQKVYSIWICPRPAKSRRNTILDYRMKENAITGDYRVAKENYDLIEVIVLYLNDSKEESGEQLIDMLSVLFSERIEAEEKKNILQETYKIPMQYEIEKGVDDMCNLGEGIYRRGLNDGFNKRGFLMYIQMIMRKLGKEKCREQIVCEMLEDTDIEESQVFDIYNLVSANIGRTAEEIYELYEGEM